MKVGCLNYATRQGLGVLMKSFYDAGVVTDPVIYVHNSRKRETHFEWYPLKTPRVRGRFRIRSPEFEQVLNSVDVMLFFETPFDWTLIHECQRKKVKTVLIPMYEWTPVDWPAKPDALICPSLLDEQYFIDEFPKGRCNFIPIPVDNNRWKLRNTAVRFLHNAGNIGSREHKGTRQLLYAAQLVKNPNFRLTVRGQDVSALESIVKDTGLDPRVTVEYGEQYYDTLWDCHDIYIAPEKYNGLSLPLQEAYAAGLPVITTCRFPYTTWLPEEFLIPVAKIKNIRIAGWSRPLEESIVEHEAIAAMIDQWCEQDITQHSLEAKRWADANSWRMLKPRYVSKLVEIIGKMREEPV